MNLHRHQDKLQARQQLEMLAFEVFVCSEKYKVIDNFVDPIIVEYEKKFGNDRFLRHYVERVSKIRRGENEVF